MIVGLTSGVFDLVHIGHLSYLERCRALCDKLIVGIDCDDLVKAAKGPERPYTPELQRLELVRSFSCVDVAFILYRLDDLNRMACHFQVNKLFKHEGFKKIDKVIGLEHGAKLEIVPDVPGLVSTTEIVEKIRTAGLDKSSRSVVESMKRERDRCLEGVQKAGRAAAAISRERDILAKALKDIVASDVSPLATSISKAALGSSRALASEPRP